MLYVVTFEPDRSYNIAECGTWRALNRACSKPMSRANALIKAASLAAE